MRDIKEEMKKEVQENPDMKTNEEIKQEENEEFMDYLSGLGIYVDI